MRQIAIASLVYAGNSRGMLPAGRNPCGPTTFKESMRKIGAYCLKWSWGGGEKAGGRSFVTRVYADAPPWGSNWDGNCEGSSFYQYIGKARQPGKYMPVEILWDPIVRVRDWPWTIPDLPAGTERNRDEIVRRYGLLGYSIFMMQVGCTGYYERDDRRHLPVGPIPGYPVGQCSNVDGEIGYRPNTRHRYVSTVHKPSVWLTACIPPTGSDFASHFGRASQVPEWRFNVVHLDGHVRSSMWKEICNSKSLWLDDSYRPYGWSWSPQAKSGVGEVIFDGALDENE